MPDITLVWVAPEGRGDWVMAGPDLLAGDDLATAAYVSAFTDRQADAADPIPDGDRRGWWGDDAPDRIGSKLWLLRRAKATDDTLTKAKAYLDQAFAWMTEDKVASSVSVATSWLADAAVKTLAAIIVIQRPDGTALNLRFDWAWQELF